MNYPKYRLVFSEFMEKLWDRMEEGYNEYGDKSFNCTPAELIGEIEEKIIDICGWSMILYSKVKDLK